MAIVNTENLPLKYKYKFNSVKIEPFTYKSALDYLDGFPSNPADLYLYDLNWILRDDSNISELLVPDAEYLIFLKKAISIDGSLKLRSEVKCPVCGKSNLLTIDGSQLKFLRPSDEILYNGVWMELTSGTYLCKLPTVVDILRVIDQTRTYGVTKHLDLIKSLAMVNEQKLNPMQVENSILNAGSDDIATIITVYDMLYRSLEPIQEVCSNPECDLHNPNNGGMSVEVSSLIGNVFQSILLSKPVDRHKIYVKQISENTDQSGGSID